MHRITLLPWFICPDDNTAAQARVFCFPFAGGGASFFRAWSKILPQTVQLCALQLPGRETRMREQRLIDMNVAVRQIVDAMMPYLDKPFILLGCSMGALLAFEVARELRRRQQLEPLHIFSIAVRAPHSPPVHKALANLPRDEFVEEINNYYQPEDEVWNNPEILDLFLPILRDDMTIVDNYRYIDEAPLSCSIDVYIGLNDKGAPMSSAAAWNEQTTAEFELTVFNGGHFFFMKSLSELQLKVAERINQLLAV